MQVRRRRTAPRSPLLSWPVLIVAAPGLAASMFALQAPDAPGDPTPAAASVCGLVDRAVPPPCFALEIDAAWCSVGTQESLAPLAERDSDSVEDEAEPEAPREPVRVTVLDEFGSPLAGVAVSLDDQLVGTTDPGGRFTLGRDWPAHEDDRHTVQLSLAGHASRELDLDQWEDAVADADANPSLPVLPRLGALEGTVLGPDGLPVVDALVVAEPWSIDASGSWHERAAEARETIQAMTDTAGGFRFDGLDVGTWHVAATLPGRVGCESWPALVGGETATCAPLQLGATASLDGHVVDAWGVGFAGARVRLLEPARDCGADEPVTARIVDVPDELVTQADGAFTVDELPPGDWRVAVLPPEGAACLPAVVPVKVTGVAAELRVALTGTPRRLRGVVVDEQGLPVAGFVVQALIEALLTDGGTWQATTDAGGRFEIEAPPGVDLLLEGQRHSDWLGVFGRVKVSDPDEVRLSLHPVGCA